MCRYVVLDRLFSSNVSDACVCQHVAVDSHRTWLGKIVLAVYVSVIATDCHPVIVQNVDRRLAISRLHSVHCRRSWVLFLDVPAIACEPTQIAS